MFHKVYIRFLYRIKNDIEYTAIYNCELFKCILVGHDVFYRASEDKIDEKPTKQNFSKWKLFYLSISDPAVNFTFTESKTFLATATTQIDHNDINIGD